MKCQIAFSFHIPYPFLEENWVSVGKLIRWLLTWEWMVWEKTSPACWWQVALADLLPVLKGRPSGCRIPPPGRKTQFLIQLAKRHSFVCLNNSCYLYAAACGKLSLKWWYMVRYLMTNWIMFIQRHIVSHITSILHDVTYCVCLCVCVCVRSNTRTGTWFDCKKYRIFRGDMGKTNRRTFSSRLCC